MHQHTPTGLHHITALTADPRANLDFYSGALGLRLVKKTVNFDDPSAYHLYYGDETGSPGSILTFFHWPDSAARGRAGAGQCTAIALAAPAGSLDFWLERLHGRGVAADHNTRFGERVVAFADPDGLPLEIVAVDDAPRSGRAAPDIPADRALLGLHAAELTVRDATRTEALLTGPMGWRLAGREGNRARFAAPPAAGLCRGFVDVVADAAAAPGRGGPGSVHHLAFNVPDDQAELAMQRTLRAAGLAVSDVLDRTYFKSIYYREPGGVLFEIATAAPGFTVDESAATLGTALKLPARFEHARDHIEQLLPPLSVGR